MEDQQRQCPHAQARQVMPRRGFLKWIVGLLSGGMGTLIVWPMISAIVRTAYRLRPAPWVKVGAVDSLPIGQPVSPKFEMPRQEEFLHGQTAQDVWVIRHQGGDLTVFSPVCPHLGCHYNWYPLARKFICPCHGSVFALNGKVEGGPSPRPLDTLTHKVEDGELYIRWELFRVGIPEKVRVG